MTEQGNQIVTRTKDSLAGFRDQICGVLPPALATNKDQVERWWNVAMGAALSSNPKLLECSPRSVCMSVYAGARLGLSFDPALGQAYLIPRKGAACFQMGYMGYMELARRSRRIAAMHAEVVYANDKYEVHKGTERRLVHQPWDTIGAAESGELVAAYVTWIDTDSGTNEFHYIGKARVDRAKKSSQTAGSSFSPWDSDPAAMWRKTAVLDAKHALPLTADMAYAIQLDEELETGRPQSISPQMDDEKHPPVDAPDDDDVVAEADFIERDAEQAELSQALQDEADKQVVADRLAQLVKLSERDENAVVAWLGLRGVEVWQLIDDSLWPIHKADIQKPANW